MTTKELLKEYRSVTGKNVAEIAKEMSVCRQTVYTWVWGKKPRQVYINLLIKGLKDAKKNKKS